MSNNYFTTKTDLKVKINPLVDVSILDAFCRKPSKESRCVGTLLGMVKEGNLLEITDCFVVPHSDSEARGVLLDQSYNTKMLGLKNAATGAAGAGKEYVVGWFSVTADKSHIDETTTSELNYYRWSNSGNYGKIRIMEEREDRRGNERTKEGYSREMDRQLWTMRMEEAARIRDTSRLDSKFERTIPEKHETIRFERQTFTRRTS